MYCIGPNLVESFCELFTDDAKLFNSPNAEKDCIFQKDIDRLSEWSHELSFNIKKCETLYIGPKNPSLELIGDLSKSSWKKLYARCF